MSILKLYSKKSKSFNKISKIKLNYMPVVSHTEPAGNIPVSSIELERLSNNITKKCRQNRIHKEDLKDDTLFYATNETYQKRLK